MSNSQDSSARLSISNDIQSVIDNMGAGELSQLEIPLNMPIKYALAITLIRTSWNTKSKVFNFANKVLTERLEGKPHKKKEVHDEAVIESPDWYAEVIGQESEEIQKQITN